MLLRRGKWVQGTPHSASWSEWKGVVAAVSYEISVALCKLCAKLQNQQLCWQRWAARTGPNRFSSHQSQSCASRMLHWPVAVLVGGLAACLLNCSTAALVMYIFAALAYLNATINFYVYLPSLALTSPAAQALNRNIRRLAWSSVLSC